MCEYCTDIVNKKLPNSIDNKKASIRILLDGKPHMDASTHDSQITRFYYTEISYCPMCGRRLDGRETAKLNAELDAAYLKKSCDKAINQIEEIANLAKDISDDVRGLYV